MKKTLIMNSLMSQSRRVMDKTEFLAAIKLVSGEELLSMVTSVHDENGDYLIVNEEGKLMNLPLNPEATALWRSTFTADKYVFGHDDFVVGPAILIKAKALKRWAA